jgi:hypothetical protein
MPIPAALTEGSREYSLHRGNDAAYAGAHEDVSD